MGKQNLIKNIGFSPKEGTANVYNKIYTGGYIIEVDFENERINYGKDIKSESKTTQNFSQEENFVVLECIDRLLSRGYKPKDIILEKIFPAGHGHSGRLDIFVKKDKKAFLMIECKTWGKEFDKESSNIQKNGGQLFTYFQNDTNTDYLMLYTSRFSGKKAEYNCEIIKIEENYRTAGNVEDVYNRWNKIINKNGIFESWVEPYKFQNKLLTKRDLQRLTEEDSGKIFNSFASILRKHSVSDKPNAFNKIFNLFLAKIYDEKKRDNQELDFQWKEKLDNPVDFQIRLINLHKDGLFEFLRKEIVGISQKDFAGAATAEELYKKKKDRLKFDKLFDIKEVFDDDSFDDNFRVLKEVVQLLEKYQIRYPRRQRHLSDFFERLLTTGLKQEAGQYFTPVPVTHFIVRSLPVKEMIEKALNRASETLPAVIDYAAGSGHFITEILETYQDIIDNLDITNYYPDAAKKVKSWQSDQYSWAAQYIYGIEKDYRLVKVAKVGCYFYGDGLAQIFHADGLDSFTHSKTYDGLLKTNAGKPQFDIVVSNPPYSVDTFKGDLRNKDPVEDFSLYKNLTDKSSEIECLFVERTAQLLKENGIAGVILPISMLSNTGIYTKTREILLEKFEIIAITQFGANTFMETNTSTAVFFLRRRNDEKTAKIKEAAYSLAETYPKTKKDITVGGIENPVTQYLAFTGAAEIDAEKLYYFILACHQKVVVVKTGEKDAEKRFLGYEFSNRRGYEGIHPIERGKRIEDCTLLFDDADIDNPERASSYIYRAFKGDVSSPIAESMKDNVFRLNLVDMIAFDRKDFEKTISLAIKKETFMTRWEMVSFSSIADIVKGVTYAKIDEVFERTNNIILTADNITLDGRLEINKEVYLADTLHIADDKYLKKGDIFICFSSGSKEHLGKVAFIKDDTNYCAGGFMGIIRTRPGAESKYLYILFNSLLRQTIRNTGSGANINNLSKLITEIEIPLPPKEIQKKIVAEIEDIERQENSAKLTIKECQEEIKMIVRSASQAPKEKLEDIACLLKRGKSAKYGISRIQIIKSGQARGYYQFDFTSRYFVDDGFVPDERALQKGDILINSTGVGTAGRITLFNLDGDFVVDSHITILRIRREKASPVFVLHALADGIGFKNIEAMAQGQSGQIELSLPVIENIKIPLPSLPEQERIADQIKKWKIKIEDLQKKLDQFSPAREAVLKKYL